jgi:hypothetical protein
VVLFVASASWRAPEASAGFNEYHDTFALSVVRSAILHDVKVHPVAGPAGGLDLRVRAIQSVQARARSLGLLPHAMAHTTTHEQTHGDCGKPMMVVRAVAKTKNVLHSR